MVHCISVVVMLCWTVGHCTVLGVCILAIVDDCRFAPHIYHVMETIVLFKKKCFVFKSD